MLVVSHFYHVEMAVGSLSYARDLLHVEWENPLVSYSITDPRLENGVPSVEIGTLPRYCSL